jgi:hypothetical protein
MAALCFDKLKDALQAKAGENGKGTYFFDNACGLMKAKNAISGLQAKQCTSK